MLNESVLAYSESYIWNNNGFQYFYMKRNGYFILLNVSACIYLSFLSALLSVWTNDFCIY